MNKFHQIYFERVFKIYDKFLSHSLDKLYRGQEYGCSSTVDHSDTPHADTTALQYLPEPSPTLDNLLINYAK